MGIRKQSEVGASFGGVREKQLCPSHEQKEEVKSRQNQKQP